MDLQEKVKSLLKEASVYDAHGLYKESSAACIQADEIIKTNAHLIDQHKKLLNTVSRRLERLKKKVERIENESVAYQMPNVVLDVMKNQFSSAEDPLQAALEGALVLAGFEQYESALEEFRKLMKHRSTRLVAAKNIIRCHLSKGRAAEGMDLLRHWRNSGLLRPDELAELRRYTQKFSDERGLEMELPYDDAAPRETPRDALHSASLHDRQVMDFTSVSIRISNDAGKDALCEFDIQHQSGDVLSVLVLKEETGAIAALKPGAVLDPVQCFSANAMFSGKAIVVENTPIPSGAHAGHFSIDIKIQGI